MILTKATHRKCAIMLLIFWMAIYNNACNEVRTLHFTSFHEAVETGEITRGWIPEYLPDKSSNIHIIYDITSSITWCMFDFFPDDIQDLKKVLEPEILFLPTRLQQIKRPDSFWPEFLSGSLNFDKISENGFSSYVLDKKCYQGFDDTALLFFVINWGNGKGFFHRTICQ